MNSYGVTFKDSGETIRVEAEYFELHEGFLEFYTDNVIGTYDCIAMYDADNIAMCVLQEVLMDMRLTPVP